MISLPDEVKVLRMEIFRETCSSRQENTALTDVAGLDVDDDIDDDIDDDNFDLN